MSAIKISNNGLKPTSNVEAYDSNGDIVQATVAGELPLTVKLNNIEIVTLMTLGTRPEELALGYLRNQNIISNLNDVKSINVDWKKEIAEVEVKNQDINDILEKIKNKTITTGCGQGTMFSCTLDKLYDEKLPNKEITSQQIFNILTLITKHNDIYKKAGAVHGCAICGKDKVHEFVEDVGRHNAADTLAGIMWINQIEGLDKIFYTTGRLTSEIVMKVKNMKIPILLSRSGVTQMGIELAKDLNVTMIARATQRSFLVYNNSSNIIYNGTKKE